MFQLVRSYEPITDSSGIRYQPRAYGDRQPEGSWDGWLVFFPITEGGVAATDRETTQLGFADLVHWASTITPVYLEGALNRALRIREEPTFSARLAELALLDRRAAEDTAALESAAARARADAATASEEAALHEAAAAKHRAEARERAEEARTVERELERIERARSEPAGEKGSRSRAADSRRRRDKPPTTPRKKPR